VGILSIVLQVILGLGFLMFGAMKFSKQMVEEFRRFGYSAGFRIFTGVVEIIAAGIIIAGIWNDKLAAVAGLLIAATMLGAIITHIKVKDPANKKMMPIVLLILSLAVFFINYGSLV
jgi:putative oxidoreductase